MFTGTEALPTFPCQSSNRIDATNGQLTRAYTYDSMGNTLSDGTRNFTYDSAGRMGTSTNAGVLTSYAYNALGQRVRKSNSNATTYFVYDEAGHLLGEYDATGAFIQEIVWLGDIPVASIRANEDGNGVGVFYIHTDHLNAPTKLTRSTDNAIVWRWDHDPFGNGAPNEDPDGNGLFVVFNLRFPGMYQDQETGLLYNGYRYFDPATGRYPTSDPIGLAGGINTYAYVNGNPISNYDPNGLECTSASGNTSCAYPGGVAFRVPTPPGFPSNIQYGGRLDFLYHKYDVQVPLNGADEKCVMQKLIDNPTPGTPKPATPNGTANNATVLTRDNNVLSYLTSDVNTAAQVVVNITQTNSLFADGYVARSISNGVVHTYGEGTSAKQSPIPMSLLAAIGVDPNDLLWGEQMRKFVKECSCGQ